MGEVHMNKGRAGKDRGSKNTDGCPLTISHNKVEMDPVKIAGVADWPTPSNKKEMQSFVSFINLY
jgi:hypothetical protein